MSNYNIQLQSNNIDLQKVLQTLQTKATDSEQVTPEISVSSNGLITATAGTKTSTHQLAFQPAKIITPSATSQIAVSSGYYTGGNVMVAGDANLVAGNIKSGVSIFGVSGTLESGGSSGGGSGELVAYSENEDAMINRTISSYTNDRVIYIGPYAFAYCSRITSASFPAASIIGNGAFTHCYNLTSVSFPTCQQICSSAFDNCDNLTSVSFPTCTSIGSYAFTYCNNLALVNMPLLSSINYQNFAYCKRITSVNFPAVTGISAMAFVNCYNLISVSFPTCTCISSSAFLGCSSLTTVSFPVCTTIGNSAFQDCYSLTTVSFPACTTIGSYAFRKCYNLKSLYLTGSSLCKLSNSHAFTSTPIGGYSTSAGTYGSIYVPASLLTSYQTATNWTYFSSRFCAIDETEPTIITFTIDGTEYQAEEGMTWFDWCGSEYNVDAFDCDFGGVYHPDGSNVDITSPWDIIMNGATYYFK